MKRAKRAEQASQQPRVSVNGHELDNVLHFDYLGCRLSGDGDDRADISHRMNIAQARFTGLQNIWKDNRLQTSLKVDLYRQSVCSSFTHGSEIWTLKPAALRSMNGCNSRCVHQITGRSYREEATEPTFDLVRAVRQRRMRWLGHILRMPEYRLVRRTVSGLAVGGQPYPSGCLLMDCNQPFEDAVITAADRVAWNTNV